MDPVPGTEVDLPEVDNIMKLKVKVTPTDGLYQGATFSFDLDIPHNYPYEPPKATCTTMVPLHARLHCRTPWPCCTTSLVHLSQSGVRPTTQVYHPNIDLEGHVCLNILRADWMPVLSLGSVIFGLMTLFLVRLFSSQCPSHHVPLLTFYAALQEPNPDDPLNKEAAQLMIDRPRDFERNVKQALQGGYVAGKQFPRLLK